MEMENGEDAPENADALREYMLPSPEILTPSPPFDYDSYEATVKRQARQLEKAFGDFGFNVKVVDIQTGPVIAQFEIQLEKGLRLNKILGLTDDLAIALKVPSVRIVAPLPGKNTVGIELPNVDRQVVRLRDVMEQSEEAAAKMAIPIYLGMDVTGQAMPVDLAKLPHLLIAGRTGTGKSVCLNSIIVSMLMTRKPDEVKMLMIDPKMVELSPYKTIPHLMHPVVTDMRKAEAILGWAVDKMEERYQLLACAGVRQLSEYNKLTEEQLYKRIKPATTDQWDAIPKKMPYLIIVADEMADLMMTSGKEVETHIIRLAQKSRAVGIHLVLATQKPTVDIITGLIKSNLPARIAFEVASRSDSQVVLDRNGAEKLLGNGDMLFLRPGTSQVVRGQGTYVSDSEIEAIIAEVSTVEQEFAEELAALETLDDAEEEDGDDDYDETGEEESGEPPSRFRTQAGKSAKSEKSGKTGGRDSKVRRDDLYYKAVEHVIREGRGSVSLLQRKMGIGYGRASRMIDFMAEDGVVGEHNGSQAREVIISLSQWKRR
ncbi:MAG TPA: DNA translocase FtsK, partial [Planctomycetaceae bacterium]|nr:DNA translocase FtsK [Planctomycetaceae bacterium]